MRTMDRTAEPTTEGSDSPVVALPRRTIDKLLIGVGIVATVVFIVAGALLSWGANFSDDYVYDELSSQQIFFPDEARLREEGRTDLLKHAGVQVTTGEHAEAYASYIDGHLEGMADGQTYAEYGQVERTAQAAVTEAQESGASATEIEQLQAAADEASETRNSLFKGETLRGLLLSAYAWHTIGRIAGIAAVVAYVAAAAMAVLVVLGIVHVARMRKEHRAATA